MSYKKELNTVLNQQETDKNPTKESMWEPPRLISLDKEHPKGGSTRKVFEDSTPSGVASASS